MLEIQLNSFFMRLNRYAEELVKIMYGDNGPDFGAASDGTYFLMTTNNIS